ncbi:MAG: ABC-type transport auxiliary lipoprotein family protein, partial [Pseudomonadota bacterium]
MIRRLRPAALALLLLAPGCAELDTLRNVATPTELYGLSPKSTFPDDLPEISAQLVVEDPTAHAAVDTDRIAVKPHPLRVQYFPGVRWVERAPLTVQRLLIESFENTDRLRSVGRSAVGLRADYTLSVDLREFQAELRRDDPEAPVTARVQLNLKIVKQPDGLIVGSRSFARRIPAESDEMLDVVIAFDT